MNNGKICVSVCAETAEDLIAQIKRAEELADVIEIRLDCLDESETKNALKELKSLRQKIGKPFIITFRPKEQGGNREIDFFDRIGFWLQEREIREMDFVDIEFDLFCDEGHNWKLHELKNSQFICSYHNFKQTYGKLNYLYERLANTKLRFTVSKKDTALIQSKIEKSIIKIATQTHDITETLPIWELLKFAKRENRQIIPIAMGEAGKWTRILGLAHGAFMTYSSLDSGKETAPGQVSVADLIDVYRVKSLNEQTEVYGIIGGNTSYSMSPFMHNAAFKFHDLNAVFVPLQMQNLDEFITRMVRENSREIELNFKGFSVTNPQKQNIIKHLDFIDETAKTIGAVNTVKIADGKLHGYNTDAHGFITPLKNTFGDLSNAKVAVFGAGGAARACIYALKCAGAEVTIFARDLAKAKILAEEFQIKDYKLQITNAKAQKPKTDYNEFDIIVNSTPLGTKGKLENESIAVAEQIENVKLIYDLVYNPFQTKLMTEADKVHVPKIGGMAMLVAQGMKQFEIWTGKTAPMKEMCAAVLKRLQ